MVVRFFDIPSLDKIPVAAIGSVGAIIHPSKIHIHILTLNLNNNENR